MGAAMFISMGVVLMLFIPIIAFFLAKRVGRRPWLWFCISLILPGIAAVILFMLPDLSENNETVHN